MTQTTPEPASSVAATPVQRTRFPTAPPNLQVIIITGLFVVTFLYFGAQYTIAAALDQGADSRDLIFAGIVGLMMLWRAANAVRGYVLETGGSDGPDLVVQQWVAWRRIAIPLDRLRRVDTSPAVRSILNTNLLSLGGLFGWSGPSTVPELGSVLVYATSRNRLVLLELAPRGEQRFKTSDGTEARGPAVLVSPRDPDALAAALAPFCTAPSPLALALGAAPAETTEAASKPPATPPARKAATPSSTPNLPRKKKR